MLALRLFGQQMLALRLFGQPPCTACVRIVELFGAHLLPGTDAEDPDTGTWPDYVTTYPGCGRTVSTLWAGGRNGAPHLGRCCFPVALQICVPLQEWAWPLKHHLGLGGQIWPQHSREGSINRCHLSASQATFMCRAKLWVSSLVTRGSCYTTAWQQPPANSSWCPCHNSSQRPAREDCTTRPWSVFSTTQPANPSFFPAQLFSISAQETCPVFDSWVLLYEAIMGRLSGWNRSQSGCGITLDSERQHRTKGSFAKPQVSLGSAHRQATDASTNAGFSFSRPWCLKSPPSLFLSCLLATASSF